MSDDQPSLLLTPADRPKTEAPSDRNPNLAAQGNRSGDPALMPLYLEVAESVRDYFRSCRSPHAEPIMLAIRRMRSAIVALHHAENPP